MKTQNKILTGSALALASISPSFAVVDAAVTTALTDAGTDSNLIATSVLVLLVGIAAFRYMRKAL